MRTAVLALAETDGGELWAAHKGGSINAWDGATGALVRNLPSHKRAPAVITFPIWQVRNLPTAHDGPVWAVQPLAHADGRMASAGADGYVRLWDVRQPRPTEEYETGCAVYALATGAGAGGLGEGLLATGGYDGCLRLWDARSSNLLTNLQAHRAPVRSLLLQHGAVWSGSTDGTLRCWDLAQLVMPPKQSPGRGQREALQEYIRSGALNGR